ncbi:hypothetical protein P167DRAFT_588534 [Morchella conica CCBAS932]|uniref:Uncharacterized protein n=1 Tax=Morchella conica CCBAS932 TaxID=1392247 RepID=A0A3N4KSN6_9PEZI|nr:hypothetical protein P167DRAFT_588534 [Morchella conica CCBAS932]
MEKKKPAVNPAGLLRKSYDQAARLHHRRIYGNLMYYDAGEERMNYLSQVSKGNRVSVPIEEPRATTLAVLTATSVSITASSTSLAPSSARLTASSAALPAAATLAVASTTFTTAFAVLTATSVSSRNTLHGRDTKRKHTGLGRTAEEEEEVMDAAAPLPKKQKW